MKVLVPFKVVPSPDTVRFQPGLNRIVREGVTNVLNPPDLAALHAALGLRARLGGEVVAVTMGPPEISPMLDQVAALGVDRVVHLCDPRFAGADTLATSRALAQVARAEQAGLLVFGRSAIDGGTAQTPAQVAELLGLPFLDSVVEIRGDDSQVDAVQEHDEGDRLCQIPIPAVLSVEIDGAFHNPGDPAPVEVGHAVSGPVIERWDAERLGGDDADYGIRGSRTYVQRVDDAGRARECRLLDAAEALGLVAEATGERATTRRDRSRPVDGNGTGDRPVIWVVAEHYRGRLHPTSLEGLACAAQVSEALGASAVAVVLTDEPGEEVHQLATSGADLVLVGRAAQLAGQPPEVMLAALAQIVPALSPTAVMAPWSSRGRHYLPRLAARLGLGLTGDFVGLDTSPHPSGDGRLDLVWLKPAWSGNALARVVARTVPSLGTLRPGAVRPLSPSPAGPCSIEEIDLDPEPLRYATRRAVAVSQPDEAPPVSVETATVVLCIGERVGTTAARELREQAALQGWAFAGTPAAVQRGLVPARSEISLVKRSISPPVFIGVGLGGGEDLAAVRNAGLVVTVGSEGFRAADTDVLVEMDPQGFAACLARAPSAPPAGTARR